MGYEKRRYEKTGSLGNVNTEKNGKLRKKGGENGMRKWDVEKGPLKTGPFRRASGSEGVSPTHGRGHKTSHKT